MAETLKCSLCKELLPTCSFYKMNRRGRARKHQYNCKACMGRYDKERSKVDPEYKAKRLLKGQNHRKNNPEYYAMKAAEYKTSKGRTKLTEYQSKRILAIYNACSEINKISEETYQVDHIVPLRGKAVSGLHVPSNLRIITAKQNVEKSNAYDDWGRDVDTSDKLWNKPS